MKFNKNTRNNGNIIRINNSNYPSTRREFCSDNLVTALEKSYKIKRSKRRQDYFNSKTSRIFLTGLRIPLVSNSQSLPPPLSHPKLKDKSIKNKSKLNKNISIEKKTNHI